METQRDEMLDQLAKLGWEATPVERAELSLNHGWEERMPELLEHLSGLRDRRKAEGTDGG